MKYLFRQYRPKNQRNIKVSVFGLDPFHFQFLVYYVIRFLIHKMYILLNIPTLISLCRFTQDFPRFVGHGDVEWQRSKNS